VYAGEKIIFTNGDVKNKIYSNIETPGGMSTTSTSTGVSTSTNVHLNVHLNGNHDALTSEPDWDALLETDYEDWQ
jgi:hypothetical protein